MEEVEFGPAPEPVSDGDSTLPTEAQVQDLLKQIVVVPAASSPTQPLTPTGDESPAVLFQIEELPLELPVAVSTATKLERPLNVNVREVGLLDRPPWVRSMGKLTLEVTTFGWRFPTPMLESLRPAPPADWRKETKAGLAEGMISPVAEDASQLSGADAAGADGGEGVPVAGTDVTGSPLERTKTLVKPPSDMVLFKDRLLYLLQPPLEDIFHGRQVELPFQPYPYQIRGIAFLMPRDAALIADEMGLGKTAQVIVALRLLFHGGLIQRALVACPKPLVINWTRELKTWASDIPFEVIGGDTPTRKSQWLASRCPVKLVNYELLTRDAEIVTAPPVHFDVVVLDEAQRIKNRESKTAQVVRNIPRSRSWAMTGTPIENRVDDLVNIFAFVDPDRVPADTPHQMLRELTQDSILRRVKEDVATDMPPRVIRDTVLELTPSQRIAYDRAEKDGIIHLNDLGETITVQHVFELVMRLKQICNFDPATGESAKLEQLVADMAEVAACDRKAIIFSQYVSPLEIIAGHLAEYGPLQYHGKIPQRERQPILDQFKADPTKHVLLMSYGTGSVGLNLQFTNYVFLFDRWWNPAIEDQAINRAHRLGQKETVFVTRFISTGTIEERIHEILEKKRQLFQDMLGQNGPPPSMGLSEDEIFGLFNVKKKHAA